MLSPPVLYGIALQLVMQMLFPEDIARARMTCKTWNEDLKPGSDEDVPEEEAAAATCTTSSNSSGPQDAVAVATTAKSNDSTFMWKQAAKNLEPGVAQAVMDVAESQGTSLDVHRLAAGLTSHRKRKHPEPLELPEPKFRIEDLTIIIDIKRKIVTKDDKGQDVTRLEPLGTLTCNDCSNLLRGEAVSIPLPKGQGLLVEAANPLHSSNPESETNMRWWISSNQGMRSELGRGIRVDVRKSLFEPIGKAGKKAMEDLVMTPFLLRRDDWRTFSPLLLSANSSSRTPIDGLELINDIIEAIRGETLKFTRPPEVDLLVDSEAIGAWDSSTSFACNESRAIAEQVMDDCHNDDTFVAVRVSTSIKVEVAALQSDDEPIWQRKTREMMETRRFSWTNQDMDELRSPSKFQFRLKTVNFDGFRADAGEYGAILEGKELLLILESLDWK